MDHHRAAFEASRGDVATGVMPQRHQSGYVKMNNNGSNIPQQQGSFHNSFGGYNSNQCSDGGGEQQQQQGGGGPSMVLGQYRRHSASLSAAPLRGSQFSEGRPTRSNSWAPDSPKKSRGFYKGGPGGAAAGGRTGMLFSLLRHLQESVFSTRALRNNRKELILWVMMCGAILVGYKLWSDGGFSAILTLSSCFQCFALILLLVKVVSQRSVVGVSRRTLWLITASLCSRLTSTLFYNGYLPVDRSGDWVYQAADALSVVLCVMLLLYGATAACRATQQQQSDKDNCWVLLPTVVAVVLGMVIHPTLNQNFLADVSWTVALYIETFAMVPQLWLMTNLGGEVEALTSHYMASMCASKFFSWLFWYFSYAELVPRAGGRNYAGWAVILSYSAQTLLFFDFLYYYLKSLRNGKTMIIDF